MKNYFDKYANYFIIIGVVFLAMYIFGYVPYKLRNSPDLYRWLFPLIFLIIGLVSKINHTESNVEKTVISNNNNNYQDKTNEVKSDNEEKNEFVSPKEWFQTNPGKNLNDYYSSRNSSLRK
jgi:hypothetical protein